MGLLSRCSHVPLIAAGSQICSEGEEGRKGRGGKCRISQSAPLEGVDRIALIYSWSYYVHYFYVVKYVLFPPPSFQVIQHCGRYGPHCLSDSLHHEPEKDGRGGHLSASQQAPIAEHSRPDKQGMYRELGDIPIQ